MLNSAGRRIKIATAPVCISTTHQMPFSFTITNSFYIFRKPVVGEINEVVIKYPHNRMGVIKSFRAPRRGPWELA